MTDVDDDRHEPLDVTPSNKASDICSDDGSIRSDF